MELTPAEVKAFRSSIKHAYMGDADEEFTKVVSIPSGFKFTRMANIDSAMFLLFSKDKNLRKQVESEY